MSELSQAEIDGRPPDLTNYHAVVYHHIDDYRAFRPLTEFFLDKEPFEPLEKSEAIFLAEDLRLRLAKLFEQSGWEGDGKLVVFLSRRALSHFRIPIAKPFFMLSSLTMVHHF